MNVQIHPTAVVSPTAELAPDVEIGPYAVVGEEVVLGEGTSVGPHAVIENWTRVGGGCTIGAAAVLGGAPQDLNYRGHRSYVHIGNRTVIREFATIHRSKEPEGVTVVGDDCYIMSYAHLGHDCQIGHHVVLVNSVGLGGHVKVEDRAYVSAMTPVHQFVQIGRMALLAALTPTRKDVLPYSIVEGHPPRVRGLNSVGLRRNGLSAESRSVLKQAMKTLLDEGLRTEEAVKGIRESFGQHPEALHLADFAETSQRGFYR